MKLSKFRKGQVVRYVSAPSTNTYRIVKIVPPMLNTVAVYDIENIQTGQTFRQVNETKLYL